MRCLEHPRRRVGYRYVRMYCAIDVISRDSSRQSSDGRLMTRFISGSSHFFSWFPRRSDAFYRSVIIIRVFARTSRAINGVSTTRRNPENAFCVHNARWFRCRRLHFISTARPSRVAFASRRTQAAGTPSRRLVFPSTNCGSTLASPKAAFYDAWCEKEAHRESMCVIFVRVRLKIAQEDGVELVGRNARRGLRAGDKRLHLEQLPAPFMPDTTLSLC